MFNEALLRITQRLTKVGGWAVAFGEKNDMFWTPGTFEIFEYDGDKPPSYADAMSRIHPSYTALALSSMAKCREQGEPCEYELEVLTFKGTPKWIRVAMEPERNETGKIVGLVGAIQDITLYKAEQHEHRLLSQRLLTTLECMTEAFFLVDPQWRVIYANDAADFLVHQNRRKNIGKVLWDEFPHLIHTPLYEGFHKAMRENTPFHSQYYSALMQNWIEMDAYPSPEGLAVYFRSITEQKKMAARIAASERRLKFVTQATLDVAWDWNLESNTIWWSGGLQRLAGFPDPFSNDELETDHDFWIEHIHVEDRSRILAKIERVLAGDSNLFEEKYRFEHLDGHYVSVEHRGFVVRDADGAPLQMVGGITDISDRIEMEERMLQSQRLESIGKLTGHVAHDFNNLLTVILGNAEMLQEVLQGNAEAREMAGMIGGAAVRGSDLTRRLLAFARQQALEPMSVNIDQLVENMRGMLSRTLATNIVINVRRNPEPRLALVDAHQLEGALLNLCINARDAMPDGGILSIETSAVRIDQIDANLYGEITPGVYVKLAVTDTGTGIHPDHMKHVFEPFFTTKALGKGTGLGLSSVFGFVKQSNGHVSIYSEVGSGTTVKIYLPVSAETEDKIPTAIKKTAGGVETILLVEDDDLVRSVARIMLEQTLGYRVFAVADGEAALVLLKSDVAIDLLFSDVMMPGINGRELMQKARLLRPGLRVLLTSGFADSTIAGGSNLETDVQLLPKPYPLNELARKVREVLDR